MATKPELDLFADEVLGSVGRNADRLSDQEITGFLAVEGKLYDRELMIIGRSVNGWTTGVIPRTLCSPVTASEYARVVFASVTSENSCPMRWVTDSWGNNREDYNPKRSAFWRVIRAVAGKLELADFAPQIWSSHLLWSNLYKVAPRSGGNPSNALCAIQLSACIKLLELELQIYRPRKILFLTGRDWALPFLRDSDMEWCGEGRFIQGRGRAVVDRLTGTADIVVAAHPQGKPESAWVADVVEALCRDIPL